MDYLTFDTVKVNSDSALQKSCVALFGMDACHHPQMRAFYETEEPDRIVPLLLHQFSQFLCSISLTNLRNTRGHKIRFLTCSFF